MSTLQTYLNTLGIRDNDWKLARDFFMPEELVKGDFYLREGQIPSKVSFIEKGLFRLFYQVRGEEKLMLFFTEGQLMTVYFGFLTHTASLRPIQALEDSRIYSIQKEHLHMLFDRSRDWERVGRQLAESAYVTSVMKANRLLHDDYDTRVQTLMEESPSLLQRVPQYMLASYLNMKPETFSRVKKRMMKTKTVQPSIHRLS
jgi:CRP-like cAMP-binding protein